MLKHGGRLIAAAEKYKIPVDQWIDLSTGINPHGWPVPEIPEQYFSRLPEDDDGLINIAKNYYATDSILAIAGSQSVIQLLPKLRAQCRVAVPNIAYAEHGHAWKQAGHIVDEISSQQIENNIDQYDVVIVINPNNPTGEQFKTKQLLNWHKQLKEKNGWLIIDEAFIDALPENSLASYADQQGLIVLRSVGKFFGLAGIRSGFVLAESNLLNKIQNALGPWPVTGVTRFIASMALSDKDWQDKTRSYLEKESKKLNKLISFYSKQEPQGSVLFQTLLCNNAVQLNDVFSSQGILLRLLDNKQGIRFGLPKNNQWQRLENVFKYVFEITGVGVKVNQ